MSDVFSSSCKGAYVKAHDVDSRVLSTGHTNHLGGSVPDDLGVARYSFAVNHVAAFGIKEYRKAVYGKVLMAFLSAPSHHDTIHLRDPSV